ncbi:universal stress protein family protein [Janthinobacterium sp. HH103]|uniref:universal stress protein n=1 Tax=unclassified Janthinobacterium TaxID=2610881 RepID=UPI000874ADAC|nr:MULTISPECIES: universal stress protein [unclassified Janthinobacterium]OEZ66635.1 universal stress protein family protein [Janthinobacterium sp. HH103]OEZ69581.1 universal stress protein family protein [Janthinobacterium sp. HH100]QOU72625.1 Universal stress protein family protein [Janthinobacterium sp. HH102]
MTYKTVLLHIDDSAGRAARIEAAASIAQACGGHLTGVALTGVSRLLYQHQPDLDADPNLSLHLNFLRDRATRALDGFEQQVRAAGVASFEQRVVDDEAAGGISLLARYADLVVISQYNAKDKSPSVMRDFPAYVLLHSGRPVLIVPYAPPLPLLAPPAAARNVLISWNASKEASRAVTAALPLLQRAGQVHVAIFDAQVHAAEHGEQPGAELVHYLARHGVEARLHLLDGGGVRRGDIGEALLSQAADLSVDLLVMGAYGHSRLRETILGGVTRTILQSMTIPVLMAH